ncbi:hypothetical protein EDB86DRAFT_3078309 [Lactarius hatsudake]|nr:hypothetical protein EDB86DRAFT_3078309 [Lactarius hatsudake]
MAAPPGDDPRLYSPSKLTALPTTYLTPSNDSLNNSGAYAQAIPGPIIASGHGQPARRDGQAFWDDTAPTPHPILISSDNPPAAGRSPQDSQMGSPESEEVTLPAILTTQISPNTQVALLQALPSASTPDSQQLWANVPSFPTDLPPQPEEIEIRRLGMEPRNSGIDANLTFKWHNLAAAIRAGLLSDPMDPNAISMSGYDPDGDEDEFLADLNKTLADEIKQDVSLVLQGWSTYVLRGPIELRKGHELPTTKNEFNCMVNCVLTALDAGASSHDGETMVKAITPQSWMRLTLATLAAITRGALRSPSALRSGSRLLSGVDSFPLHKDLDHPLTEGGAILLMCQQLGGLYRLNWNHPDKSYPDSYYDRLTTLLDSRMHQVPETVAPAAPAPLTEADRAQLTAATRERLILEGLEAARVDQTYMNEIKDAVKAEIYANLNAEALENAEEWRALYKHEFVEAMHSAFEAQYPGIHPNKGKAKAMPPATHSQVVRDAQPRIQQEVKLQVEARIADVHKEIKESLATDDPFWREGPLRESIARDLRAHTEEQVRKDLEEEIQALKVSAQDELDALRAQIQFEYDVAHKELHAQARREYEEAKSLFATNLEKDVDDFKETIKTNVKEWKVSYRDARNLSALRREARRFGCNVVPADEGSSAAEKALFKKHALTPLEVEGRDFSAEPPTPQDTPFSTPPNLPTSLPDLNVTPTPVRTKRHRMEEPAVYPPLSDALFLPVTTPTQTPIAASIPLPTPMDEDLDYALEVCTDHLHRTGGGIHSSIHAPSSGTNHLSREHNHSATPQGAPRDAQSEGQPTDPTPVPLRNVGSTLEEPVSAPPPQQTDPLAAILAAINATITGLEGRLAGRLDAQDKRIEALSLLTRPPPTTPSAVKGPQAKGKGAVAAPPRPNTSSSSSGAGKTSGPVPRVDDPAPQDPPEEIVTPGVAATKAAQPTTSRPTVIREAFQPPPDKVAHLTTDSRGKPTPATSMPPSWANITKAGFKQQQQNSAQATAVTGGTGRSSAGKARPETVQRRAQSGNTEATVIRYHGVDDLAFEATIRKMSPSSIISQTRDEVDRLTGGRVTLLSGRWSTNKKLHNFVYTFKGQLPFKEIYPLRDVLVKPLMTGHLVPNDGWTFAQIRDTTTSDATGTVYSGSQLEDELRRNPAFEDVIFCVAPHWQGSIHKISQSPHGTVKFAYVDETGQVTARAKRDGVFLFNERTRFVPTGDVATIKHAPSQPTPSAASSVAGHITPTTTPHTARVPTTRSANAVASSHALTAVEDTTRAPRTDPPPRTTATPPSAPANPPRPSAKGKEREQQHDPTPETDVLVPTQREEAPFQTVTRKRGRKAKRTAKAQAAKATLNAAIPGSSSFAHAPLPPAKGKITSIVPARPAYKGKAKGKSYPTPPSWKEAPIVTARHVASDTECAAAMEELFGHTPTTEDLLSLHVAWGGHETDEEATALWTLHFKWAVKYGLPLTIAQTIDKITGGDADNAARNLVRFEEEWGKATPRNYCLSTISRDQYFAHPGDLEESIISPEDAEQNRTMARHLVNACIRFKVLEAKANNTPPPPVITEPIIEAVLNLYSHQGTYSFFSIAKASTEENDIWSAILDVHTSATTAIAAYA